MTLKDKVEQLCSERKMTVRALERQSGLKIRTIQHWDTSIPSVDKVASVAKVLDVPVEELIAVYDPTFERIAKVVRQKMDVDKLSESLGENERIALFTFKLLNDKGQEKVLEYMELLVENESYKRFTDGDRS